MLRLRTVFLRGYKEVKQEVAACIGYVGSTMGQDMPGLVCALSAFLACCYSGLWWWWSCLGWEIIGRSTDVTFTAACDKFKGCARGMNQTHACMHTHARACAHTHTHTHTHTHKHTQPLSVPVFACIFTFPLLTQKS